ncbi:MAG: DUF305 domain-containing protein [Paracoccaceae bacterium]|nr:DUF305 domain-containing protein [Paracoccaceae bacterium]
MRTAFKATLALGLALALAAPLALRAETEAAGHATHTMDDGSQMAGAKMTEAMRLYIEANERMHAAMAIEFTGDTDVDFVRGMIPHHEGAVEMARIVLEHGADPEVRKLAEGIVAAQEAEIGWMKAWLAAKGY